MAVALKRSAGRELRAARDWYNEQSSGLGRRFVLEFDDVMREVASAPLAYQVIEGEVRRVLLRRFPFSVYYIAENGAVVVLAVLHLRKHPDGWKVAT